MPKVTKIFDLNLFSGSSELIRQELGGYFYEVGGDVEFQDAELSSRTLTNAAILDESSVRDALQTNISENILPSIRYPVRLRAEDDSGINSDQQWKTYVIGGTYNNVEYPGMYNEAVYADHSNTSSLPYLPREIVNTELQPDVQVTTEYFNYYPVFQDEVDRNNTTQAPNYYLITSSNGILSWVTDRNSSVSRNRYLEIETYLTSTYISQEKTLNPFLENIFVMSQEGTIFDRNQNRRVWSRSGLLGSTQFDQDLTKLYSLMPFGNKVYFDNSFISTEGQFKNIVNTNEYQVKFLKLLKEVFQGESGLQASPVNFAINTESTGSDGTYSGNIEETRTVSANVVDLLTMMIYAYRNPTSETNNITIIDSGSYHTDFAFDTTGIYRYENTEKTLSVINDFVEKAKAMFTSAVETESIVSLESFLNQANTDKYFETMAFRVQKIGGQPTGDSNTENTVQNLWFYNQGDAIEYFDSQVKYDTEYTYKVFKYDIVQGYKYQLSDVLVTRQLATTSSGDESVYCLEFYDPVTGEAAPRLSDLGSEFDETELAESLRLRLERDGFTARLNDLIDDLNSARNEADNLQNYILPPLRDMYDRLSRVKSAVSTLGLGLASGYLQPLITENKRIAPSYSLYFEEAMNLLVQNYVFVVRHPPRGQEDLESVVYFGSEAAFLYENEAPELRPSYQFTTLQIPLDAYDIPTGQIDESQLEEVLLLLGSYISNYEAVLETRLQRVADLEQEIRGLEELRDLILSENSLASRAQINSMFPYLTDFNITIEPSLKIIEIPIDEKRMRIVDHPPNDFVVTPHHLLDQSNRLAFYCKYDTFSMNSVTYPPTLTQQDQDNKNAYLEGHDFLETSEQTQESASPARFLQVYRTNTKPSSYSDFSQSLRNTIDLRQSNGDIPTDHLFMERVKENTKYYYTFRSLNENGISGQFSSIFEAELINDGGYIYSNFVQYTEDDLREPPPKEPLYGFKKLFNIVPNIQHLQLDTSAISFNSSSVSQMSQISLGADAEDDLWDQTKYYKLRLTSKKTGKKIDINIGFKKEERN